MDNRIRRDLLWNYGVYLPGNAAHFVYSDWSLVCASPGLSLRLLGQALRHGCAPKGALPGSK